MCILAFLESRIAESLADLDDSAKSLFSEIYEMIAAANSFMRCIYHSALWLTSDERDHLLISGHKCVNYFHKCAQRAFDAHVTRWKYMPKIHLFGEILFFLERDKRRNIPSLNPLSFCTQQDEDFVGRIAVLSRAVSVRTVHSRTIGRYLVSLASSWWHFSHQGYGYMIKFLTARFKETIFSVHPRCRICPRTTIAASVEACWWLL